jgi:hypothetical protein
MRPLDILLTNNTLGGYAGSELYVRDVAIGLRNRGHRPVAYSQVLGVVAEEIKAAGILVVSDLRQLTRVPDLIHGHHNLETMTALLHFPNSPAICFCHGYVPWQEQPPLFPRILRYLAVDHACRDRLYEAGIHPDRIEVIYNFADLKRFVPREALPARPRRALVFSNYAGEDNYLPIIRQACNAAGLELDVAGGRSGRPCPHPENLLPGYDLVFAKARAAIEALAVGCAVITCDTSGFGSMVTTRNLEVLRPLNFGFRTLTQPMTLEVVAKEIAGYNALDAEEVSRRVRTLAGLEEALDQLLAVYQQVIAEFQQMKPAREAEGKAAAAYLSWLGALIKGIEPHLLEFCGQLKQENESLRAAVETAENAVAQEISEKAKLQEELRESSWKTLRRLRKAGTSLVGRFRR